MKVTIDKEFPIAAAPQATWSVLRDIESVAPCMPGASITEQVDATHYKGTVAVKVGPASLSFRGEIDVAAIDEAAMSIHLRAKGTDSTGSSTAAMDLVATVQGAEGGTSLLKGVCESTVNGKAATFGGRLMNSVADQILDQFAANFASRVAASAAPPLESRDEQGSPTAAASSPAASASAPAPSPPQALPAKQLDGLALAWGVIRSWLRSLFGMK